MNFKIPFTDALQTGSHRLLDDAYGSYSPCEPHTLCIQLSAAQIANPARILDVTDMRAHVRHNELYVAAYEESQFLDDISTDIINNSVIYVKVTCI
jgi:hypothetical protein